MLDATQVCLCLPGEEGEWRRGVMLGATQVCVCLSGEGGGWWRGVLLGATQVCVCLPGEGFGGGVFVGENVGEVGVDDLITSDIISSINSSILLQVSSSLFSLPSACFLQDLLHLLHIQQLFLVFNPSSISAFSISLL